MVRSPAREGGIAMSYK